MVMPKVVMGQSVIGTSDSGIKSGESKRCAATDSGDAGQVCTSGDGMNGGSLSPKC